MSQKRIVIIGAGFGGLALAKNLAHSNFEVLLIDKNNFHTFQPLLYQVATGGLEPDSIVYPVRRVLRGMKNVTFRMAEVIKINEEEANIETDIGLIHYDYLVIAAGSTHNFFNFDDIKEQLLPLKGIRDALDIRSFLMQNMEKAVIAKEHREKKEIVNIAIIGGGPTGIEIAGALAEMRAKVLPKDYPDFDFGHMDIHLFEAQDALLNGMSEESSKAALEYLHELNVSVNLNAMVKDFTGNAVILDDGTTFDTQTVLWTAGVKGALIQGIDSTRHAPANRFAVNEFNKLKGSDRIFAIGDIAGHCTEENPKGLPMLAQVAIQQGKHLAKNLKRQEAGQAMIPFEYKNKGTMATIGKNRAVVDLPHWKFQGRFAWIIWMFVHLLSLVGFRNKVVTLIDWIQNYINYDRPLGIIIRRYNRPIRKKEIGV
ncbi:NAD(P)/FAD-dependent oxidoreductase [bacterium]|nr:NAD(P)/FAD-dependent oxidoreductase [bacterium]